MFHLILSFSEIAEIRRIRELSVREYFSRTNTGLASIFGILTRVELKEKLEQNLAEIERDALLNLLASFEAHLRRDLYLRAQKKTDKTSLTGELRSLIRRGYDWDEVRLDDIINVWKVYGSVNPKYFHRVNAAYNFRHHLAHGRYWQDTSGVRDFFEVFSLVTMVEPHLLKA